MHLFINQSVDEAGLFIYFGLISLGLSQVLHFFCIWDTIDDSHFRIVFTYLKENYSVL